LLPLGANRGHIVGTVMWRSRGIGSKSKEGLEKYDVVREYTALGVTSVLFTHLLDGHITAQTLLKTRDEMKPSISTASGIRKSDVKDHLEFSDDEECMSVSTLILQMMHTTFLNSTIGPR
jgi:hypothetical protein